MVSARYEIRRLGTVLILAGIGAWAGYTSTHGYTAAKVVGAVAGAVFAVVLIAPGFLDRARERIGIWILTLPGVLSVVVPVLLLFSLPATLRSPELMFAAAWILGVYVGLPFSDYRGPGFLSEDYRDEDVG